MVSHLIHCSGDAGDRELQNRIIEVCISTSENSPNNYLNSRLHHYLKHLVMLKHVLIKIPVVLENICN
jgi:TRAP-type C4-dicarboxylate transport system substrate-binding protein